MTKNQKPVMKTAENYTIAITDFLITASSDTDTTYTASIGIRLDYLVENVSFVNQAIDEAIEAKGGFVDTFAVGKLDEDGTVIYIEAIFETKTTAKKVLNLVNKVVAVIGETDSDDEYDNEYERTAEEEAAYEEELEAAHKWEHDAWDIGEKFLKNAESGSDVFVDNNGFIWVKTAYKGEDSTYAIPPVNWLPDVSETDKVEPGTGFKLPRPRFVIENEEEVEPEGFQFVNPWDVIETDTMGGVVYTIPVYSAEQGRQATEYFLGEVDRLPFMEVEYDKQLEAYKRGKEAFENIGSVSELGFAIDEDQKNPRVDPETGAYELNVNKPFKGWGDWGQLEVVSTNKDGSPSSIRYAPGASFVGEFVAGFNFEIDDEDDEEARKRSDREHAAECIAEYIDKLIKKDIDAKELGRWVVDYTIDLTDCDVDTATDVEPTAEQLAEYANGLTKEKKECSARKSAIEIQREALRAINWWGKDCE